MEREIKWPLIDTNCPSTIGWPLNNHRVVGRGDPRARHLNTTVLPSVAFLLDGNVSIVAGSKSTNRNYEYFARHYILQDKTLIINCNDWNHPGDNTYHILNVSVNRNSEYSAHHYPQSHCARQLNTTMQFSAAS